MVGRAQLSALYVETIYMPMEDIKINTYDKE